MPRGFGFVQSSAQDIENRKNSGGGGGQRFFKLDPDSSAIVRFLEEGDEVHGAWVHTLDPPPGRQVGDKIPCRQYDADGNYTGDDCPGCERQLKRSFQGAINLIWRDAPVFERDGNGNLVKENNKPVISGKADQVAIWAAGITVFETLYEKHSRFHGLKSRDFEVVRKGSGFNTRYVIDPADPDGGPKPLSAADETLAADKFDLTSYEVAPSYDDWGKSKTDSQKPASFVPADTSPFSRNR